MDPSLDGRMQRSTATAAIFCHLVNLLMAVAYLSIKLVDQSRSQSVSFSPSTHTSSCQSIIRPVEKHVLLFLNSSNCRQ